MKHTYEVVAGNVGTVHSGNNRRVAVQCFRDYVELSKADYGRVAGESVYLMCDGDPIDEYQGPADDCEV